MPELKARFERFFAEVWGAENEAAIADWMLSDVEAAGILPKRAIGPAEFAHIHRAMLSAFTDVRLEIEHAIETGEWLALYGEIRVTVRSSGQAAVLPAQIMAKFVDGRLAIGRNALDFMTLFEEMGALPPETLGHLLSGGTLVKP